MNFVQKIARLRVSKTFLRGPHFDEGRRTHDELASFVFEPKTFLSFIADVQIGLPNPDIYEQFLLNR